MDTAWEALGRPSRGMQEPASEAEEVEHDRLWQAWMGKAITEMVLKFMAEPEGFARGH